MRAQKYGRRNKSKTQTMITKRPKREINGTTIHNREKSLRAPVI